jgi:GT2 family glycosyltransferase/glycosyltransferase involved in cell wall biosynthesis
LSSAEQILLAFASGAEDLRSALLDNLQDVDRSLPVYLVSEFPPPESHAHLHWLPWFPCRTFAQNLARTRDSLRGKQIVWCGVLFQPRQPYWPMRLAGWLVAPARMLVFNENLDHFRLHPVEAGSIVRHFWWRMKNLIRWQINPGGWLYTQIWRLCHPKAYRRPLLYAAVRLAGWLATLRKRALKPRPDPPAGPELPRGISVIIPSRNGRELLAGLLPGLLENLRPYAAEVLVSDNGSDDGTAAWLARDFPGVRVLVSPVALSFSRAVNVALAEVRYSHTLLLNNDMVLEPDFFEPLLEAFRQVPELFCSTAQIFLPAGVRREETGKAIFRPHPPELEFPIWCNLPVDGETHSYVYYGSGGCSLYDTRKLRQLRGLDETFTPAYVEDLDLGHRAWVRGWPTVFAADARLTHHHQATTSRYFTPLEIQTAVEINYLRFLARSVASPALFAELWRRAVGRLNLNEAIEPAPRWALPALKAASNVASWVEPAPPHPADERHALALGSGDVVSFPGRARTPGRPLVLVASSCLPWPLSHGGAVRMHNLMRRAAGEFDQVLIAFCDEPVLPAPEILDLCVEIVLVRREGSHLRPLTARPDAVEEHDSAPFRAALRELIRKHSPALVQLEFTQMALYARDCGSLPTLLVEHDITIDLYSQLIEDKGDWETRQQLRRWRSFEPRAWREVSCVVTMSDKDRQEITGARRVEVLPNGVDLVRYQPTRLTPELRRILFIGSFAHLPNLLAVDFFLRELWPALEREGATLHLITGARAAEYQALYQDRVRLNLNRPGVEVEGFVPDLRSAYRRAEVVVAPLLASAGTNIKIMEAMAMGKAVVSTPAGINGLDLHPGVDVLVERYSPALAAAILRLFHDSGERHAIEIAARQTVERQYDWDEIARAQARLYRSLLA